MHAYALGAAAEGLHHNASNSTVFHVAYYHPHGVCGAFLSPPHTCTTKTCCMCRRMEAVAQGATGGDGEPHVAVKRLKSCLVTYCPVWAQAHPTSCIMRGSLQSRGMPGRSISTTTTRFCLMHARPGMISPACRGLFPHPPSPRLLHSKVLRIPIGCTEQIPSRFDTDPECCICAAS